MQSGYNNTKNWCLESIDIPITNSMSPFGWNQTKDTYDQVKIFFKELESAVSFAKKNKLNFQIIKPNKRSNIKKSYSENFKPKRGIK